MRSVLWLLVAIGLAATPAGALADEIVLANGAVDLVSVPTDQAAGAAAAQPAAPIGQRPTDADDIRKIFLRQSAVLLHPGQVELEMAVNYLRTQVVTSVLNATYRQFQLPVTARVGISGRAEGFVSMPVAYVRQDFAFADSGVSHAKAGAGDAAAGINYELARESADRPDAVISAGVRMPTGSKPNEQGLSLGAGHWTATLGLQFIKTVDPVALFAGVHYEHEFPARYFLGDGVHDVEPGETGGYNFGFGFAVNENVSLSAQVVGSYQFETKADHEPVFGSSREPVFLRAALTYRRSAGTFLEPSVTIGLDQDTPDFAFGMFVTHRFGQ